MATKKIQILGSLNKTSARIAYVDLPAANWQIDEATGVYYQIPEIEGVTEYSQVDLTPSIEQLKAFHDKDLGFVTENDGGEVKVYALGQMPQNDYTMQVTITEVEA